MATPWLLPGTSLLYDSTKSERSSRVGIFSSLPETGLARLPQPSKRQSLRTNDCSARDTAWQGVVVVVVERVVGDEQWRSEQEVGGGRGWGERERTWRVKDRDKGEVMDSESQKIGWERVEVRREGSSLLIYHSASCPEVNNIMADKQYVCVLGMLYPLFSQKTLTYFMRVRALEEELLSQLIQVAVLC